MKFFILLLFSLSIFAQSATDPLEDYKRMREEMLGTLLEDNGHFDKEVRKLFERLQKQGAFSQLGSVFNLQNNSVKTYWEKKNDIERFVIEVGSPNDKLDIDIKNSMIILSGTKVVTKKFEGQDKGNSYSQRSFRFSKSEMIPQYLDSNSAKFFNEKGKIVIEFQLKSKSVSKKQKRRIKLKNKGQDI